MDQRLLYEIMDKNSFLRAYLVSEFKLTFSHFKQHYTFFYPQVFQKTPNNNSQTTLPNTPLMSVNK